jgi:cytochrome c oxidase assembly protein subunit 15
MLLGALRRATCLRPVPPPSWAQKIWSKPLSIHAARRVTPNSTQSPLAALRLNGQHARTHTISTAHESPLRASRIRFFSANASGEAAAAPTLPVLSPRSVGIWLLASSTLVFAIIVVGGVTRLTESGLSITEWRPITGILPPLTHEEWLAEFDKYKATPEFKMCVNPHSHEHPC